LDTAREVLAADGGDEHAEKTLRAYRLYLAGSAMSFEKGWIALHQVLATRPSESPSVYPFKRDYMYP
jgi:cyclopropane-fatty-acyl-phospholipid synthase